MSNINGIDVQDLALPTTYNYSYIDENIVDTTNGNIHNGQTGTNYGEVCPVDGDGSIYYDEAGSLFNRQLILVKELESPFDIRYKTDYFPRGGKNAGIPQSPRYLHTGDGQQEIIIKFPDGYIIPRNPSYYLLEAMLLTVPRVNQHYIHVNKFQIDHTNVNVLDQNPFLIFLTPENFEKGEIRIKLVVIKTRKNDLNNIQCLSLFGDQTSSGWTATCKSVKDLNNTYELTHARVAFSLGFLDATGQFIRFTNTTVISNEIIEKEKSKPVDEVTCPNCSHCFSIKGQKKKGGKRSASSSNSMNKKRSSKREKNTRYN